MDIICMYIKKTAVSISSQCKISIWIISYNINKDKQKRMGNVLMLDFTFY